MGQDKLLELLATQSRRNPLLLLTFRHFVPPRKGILDVVWRQQKNISDYKSLQICLLG
jgi:hypothetical protein